MAHNLLYTATGSLHEIFKKLIVDEQSLFISAEEHKQITNFLLLQSSSSKFLFKRKLVKNQRKQIKEKGKELTDSRSQLKEQVIKGVELNLKQEGIQNQKLINPVKQKIMQQKN